MKLYTSQELFDTWYFLYHTDNNPPRLMYLFTAVGIYHFGG